MMFNGAQENKARQERLLEQARENEQALSETGWTESAQPAAETAIVRDFQFSNPFRFW